MSNPVDGAEGARASQFWDDVFTGRRTDWVKDHPVQHYIDVLGVGFADELQVANVVLDVGPGHGALLAAAPAARKIAVEISGVNRRALEAKGFEVYSPESFTYALQPGVVDLAWSTSCFPHCDYRMQDRLLGGVHRALRAGGVFYLEHVMQRPGFADCPEDIRLPAGRYHRNPGTLDWPNAMLGRYRDLGADCPLVSWVVRCVR